MIKRFIVISSLLAIFPLKVFANNNLPDVLSSCLPSSSGRYLIEKHSVIGIAQEGDDTYYYVTATRKVVQRGQRELTFSQVVKVSDTKCSVIFSNPQGDFISMTNFMPEKIAKRLTLNVMRHQANKLGGVDKFLNRFYQATKNRSEVALTPEEYWALQELGYKLPAGTKVKIAQ